ncbi:MAG: hypothetical protein JST68_20460 [Bacteroidetes bacterium]|nr:hypothetical protein [Bacteroidota bacterium]
MGIIEMIAERRKEEGRKENQIATIKNMLAAGKLSMEEIAVYAGVSVYFVKKVRQGKI